MTDQQHPSFPPQGYPQQGTPAGVPRPAGVPPMAPYPPMGAVKMPAGMKMPPRPMGYPPMGGVKMPPRPAGMPPMAGVPPMGAPVPPAGYAPAPYQAPVAVPSLPEEDAFEEESVPEETVDEDGFIDDLPEDEEEQPVEDEEISPYEENFASDFGLPPDFIRTKFILLMFFLFLVTGGGLGYLASILFQGQKTNTLPGIVTNAEIPKGRPRCGIAQKGQGCVLYVMNAQHHEMEAKEFFGYAADVLGIPKFQVETANIRYSTTRIPPGYIALFNIPPM